MAEKKMHWADIQQNTFTRWVNLHLAKRGYHCNDLAKDLTNGVLLCHLMEIISGKSIGGFNKNPRVPAQKSENCAIAISFIESEGIKLVNISGDDIYNGRLKLILGLIWTLILRYQIKSGTGDDELLRWVQSKIPSYNITGFTTDWNDGRAVCALVDALRPGYCPGHKSMAPSNALQNATTGMNTAEDRMGVAKLIYPEEMIHPKVDDKAMRTYISQFRNLTDEVKVSDASKCVAYGPGLNQGVVNQLGKFRVDTPGRGVLAVKVVGPATEARPVITKLPGGSYNVEYTPTTPGTWQVHVTLDGEHIPGSIFTVTILEEVSLGGEGKIRVFFSSTSSTEKGRQDFFDLERLMEGKKIHLRPDFDPWIPVDVLDKEDRDAIFAKAGTRKLPIVFIDDKYAGDYDAMVALNEAGQLDKLLQTMKHAPLLAQRQEQKGWAFGASASGATGSAPAKSAATTAASPAKTATSAASTPSPAKTAPSSVAAKVAAPVTPSPAKAASVPSPAAAPAKATGGKFCTACGAPINGAKFCTSCGAKQ